MIRTRSVDFEEWGRQRNLRSCFTRASRDGKSKETASAIAEEPIASARERQDGNGRSNGLPGDGSLFCGKWSFVENFEGFLDVVRPHDHETFFGLGTGRAVGVLDVDSFFGKGFGDVEKAAWSIGSVDHEDVGDDGECAAPFKKFEGVLGMIDHQADDGMVNRVRRADGVDIDFGPGQDLADGGERAGFVG